MNTKPLQFITINMGTYFLTMVLLTFSFGIWVGLIGAYFLVIRPMQEKYDNLKEEMHQQIKIGFYNNSEEEE